MTTKPAENLPILSRLVNHRQLETDLENSFWSGREDAGKAARNSIGANLLRALEVPPRSLAECSALLEMIGPDLDLLRDALDIRPAATERVRRAIDAVSRFIAQ